MSSQEDSVINEAKVKKLGRAVTDSVHERFRKIFVRCNICNCSIPGSPTAIRKHFGESHPSNDRCVYCNEKVFTYVLVSEDETTQEEKVYHKCSRTERKLEEDDTL